MTSTQQTAPMQVRYGDEVIAFEVREQSGRVQRRIAIHVEPDGRVLVDAPQGVSGQQVLDGVRQRVRWISQQLAGFRAQQVHALPLEYISGESLLYLGRRYRLKVRIEAGAKAEARMRGAFIEVTVPDRDADLVSSALSGWYRRRAAEVFGARLKEVAEPLRWVRQLPPTRLQFMTRQWGSCSPAGRLTLNPWLVRAPREAIDYVLLHELCHLKHHDHSPAFYALLRRHMPDWRQRKERLDGRAEELLRV